MKNWLPFRRLGPRAIRFYGVAAILTIASLLGSMRRYDIMWSPGGVASGVLVGLIFWFSIASIHNVQLRFSTRGLFVFVTLAAIVCSWLGHRVVRARRTDSASRQLREAGAVVRYGFVDDVEGWLKLPNDIVLPNWTRRVVGDGFISDVRSVRFLPRNAASNEHMRLLTRLKGIRRLDIGMTRIDSTSFEILTKLSKLKVLTLRADQLNDEGVQHLQTLKTRPRLNLSYPFRVHQDKHLNHIRLFFGVSELQLLGSRISDKAMEAIAGIKTIKRLSMFDTKVTRAGLREVVTLTSLSVLIIRGDFVAAEDLQLFDDLPLSQLRLIGTSLSREDLRTFSDRNPDCQVGYSPSSRPGLVRRVRTVRHTAPDPTGKPVLRPVMK